MLEKVIKKSNGENVFSIYKSYEPFNYDEEGKMYISFHTTKSVSTLLNEKELNALITELTEARNFLAEKNKEKNIK